MEYIIVSGELLQMTPGLLTVKSIPPPHVTTETVARSSQDAHATT